MFNLGPAEVLFILVVALVVLGPKRLPEMARGLGKFFYEFKRQTDEVRGLVEREFYRMDDQARVQPRAAPEGVVARRMEAPPASQLVPPEMALPPGETLEGQGPPPLLGSPYDVVVQVPPPEPAVEHVASKPDEPKAS